MTLNNKHKFNLTITTCRTLISSALAISLAGAAFPSFSQKIEKIIVTAQKRSESVQDIGIAVSTVDAQTLVDSNVNNVEDLQNVVPGIQIGETFGFASIMIRGVGTDNPFAGGDPSVAMHFDGAVTGQSSAQFGSLFDIDRVEVLRGPQGTLYGRNTTGGSINVITNKPTEHTEGYVRLTAGNYGLFKLESAVGGSLSEELMGRVAVRKTERDGYGENIADGGDIDNAIQQSIRGQLLWTPSETFSLRLAGEYHDEDDANYIPKFRAASYDPAPIDALLPQPIDGVRAENPRDINSNVDLQNKREQSSFTAEMNWSISDEWDLTSITNQQDFEKVPQADFDMTDVDYYIWSESFETSQFSEELRLNYTSDTLRATLGYYYYSEDISSDNRLDLNLVPDNVAVGGLSGCGFGDNQSNVIVGAAPEDLCFLFRGTTETEAHALFTNVAYDVSDTITLNFGGRYSYENKKGDTDHWTAPGAPILTFSDEKSFNEFSPSVRVEWDANEDVMFYAGYSEGFKSGIFLSGQRDPVLDPEIMDAFEIGMKGMFFDSTLRLNSSLFRYDYTDLQQGRSVPAGSSGFTLVYENVASASINGFEMEANWLATESLKFDASFTYLDATFNDYISTDPFDTVYQQVGLISPEVDLTQQLAGNSMVQAPETAWSIGATHEYEIPDSDWFVSSSISASFKDKVYFSQFNREELSQDSNTRINANIKLSTADEEWGVNLWVKNLTDEEVYMGTFILNSSRTNAGFMSAPRTFGVTVSYNFE